MSIPRKLARSPACFSSGAFSSCVTILRRIFQSSCIFDFKRLLRIRITSMRYSLQFSEFCEKFGYSLFDPASRIRWQEYEAETRLLNHPDRSEEHTSEL